MQVDIVTTDAEFAALDVDWNTLARCSAAPSVFLFHQWFAAAWEWRRDDSQMRIFIGREGNRIVAILPLVANVQKGRSTRVWTFLTVPDTQHCEMVADPAFANAAAATFADALSRRSDWDVLELDYLDFDGFIASRFTELLAQRSIRAVLSERGRNLYISLSGKWSDYWSTRSRSLKKASNLATNRLQKAGSVRIDRLHCGDTEESRRDQILSAVVDISRQSWKKSTGNSLDCRGPGNFIRVLSVEALREGWLSIWIAYLDERPVAMEYQLIYGGAVHALRSDFVADRASDSPGSYLFRCLIESLFDQGLSRYFMGPGDNAYKARWTDEGVRLARMTAYNRTLFGTLAFGVDRQMKPVLRGLRDRCSAALSIFRRRSGSEMPQ